MNLKTTEKLIKLFANGQITYKIIRRTMPELSDNDLQNMLFPLSNTTNKLIAFARDISKDEFRRNQFNENEVIVLTEKRRRFSVSTQERTTPKLFELYFHCIECHCRCHRYNIFIPLMTVQVTLITVQIKTNFSVQYSPCHHRCMVAFIFVMLSPPL